MRENGLTLKMKRYKLMEQHKSCVKTGKFMMAKRILHFLRTGFIRLAFDDISWEVEQILEACEFHIRINSRTGIASCSVCWGV